MNTSKVEEAEVLEFSKDPEPSNWLADLEKTKDTDGAVLVNYELLKTIVNQRNKYKRDISNTTRLIKKLLLQLGIMNEAGEFGFRVGGLIKHLNNLMFSPDKVKEQFGYLGDLQQVLEDYKDA